MSFLKNLKAVIRKSKNETKRLKYILQYLFQKKIDKDLLKVGEKLPLKEENYKGLIPISIVSSQSHHCMTTFFDVDPISPCGEKLLVTNVPFINRIPFHGDCATVCVIDIKARTQTCIYKTKGWGAQLGANVQWGKDENTVLCNDIVDDKAVGVKIDIKSLEYTYLEGTIYAVDSIAKYSYSPNLKLINAMMAGYGIPEKPFKRYRQYEHATKNDGIWRTNLETGKCELLISIKEIVESISDEEYFKSSKYYIFHVKLNKHNDKLFFVLFSLGAKGQVGPTTQLVVYDFKTRVFKLLVTNKEWSRGGHHPNWMPNGVDILMNLKYQGKKMQFLKINSETGKKEIVLLDKIGGGHPSVDSNFNFLLTDAYITEGLTDTDGKVPIRLINLKTNDEKYIAMIDTNNIIGPCRIDPHPVWSNNNKCIIWNGIVEGKRRVFLADTSKIFSDEIL